MTRSTHSAVLVAVPTSTKTESSTGVFHPNSAEYRIILFEIPVPLWSYLLDL